MIRTVSALAQTARMSVRRACGLVGLARSTYYRITRGYRHYRPAKAPVPQADRFQPAALTPTERDTIVAVLERDEYADLSVCQTYWRALDAGLLAHSERTFYRVAKAHRLTGDRRRGARAGGHSRPKPVVAATRPNELWSWDVTELAGPGRERYKLMLIIDVYSRYPIGWLIEHHESRAHAVNLFTTAIDQRGVPDIVHADNGAPMRSHDLIDQLHQHQIVTSYSRPRVSDDNPFSESMFKTIKYDLDCPARFDDIDHARTWTEAFLHRYAHHHRHSGLAHHTPESVYHGTHEQVRARRQTLLDTYWHLNPKRFRHQPRVPTITPTGINTPHLSQTG